MVRLPFVAGILKPRHGFEPFVEKPRDDIHSQNAPSALSLRRRVPGLSLDLNRWASTYSAARGPDTESGVQSFPKNFLSSPYA